MVQPIASPIHSLRRSNFVLFVTFVVHSPARYLLCLWIVPAAALGKRATGSFAAARLSYLFKERRHDRLYLIDHFDLAIAGRIAAMAA